MSAFHLSSFDSDDDDSDYIPSDNEEVINQELETLPATKVIENVAETFAQQSAEVKKDRIDTLWKQFLDDGSGVSQQEVVNTNAKTTAEHDSFLPISKSETSDDDAPCKPSASKQTLRTSITEDENFLSGSSRKGNKVTSNCHDSVVKKRGLNSLLGKIQNKKPKITTLQKSLNDWESFKKDEGIGLDLEIFNRGKTGYLERQAFLMRSDLRSFEIEKSIRLNRK